MKKARIKYALTDAWETWGVGLPDDDDVDFAAMTQAEKLAYVRLHTGNIAQLELTDSGNADMTAIEVELMEA